MTPTTHLHSPTSERVTHRDSAVEKAILDAVRGLDFGSVEITVHDGRVVQMECRRKTRFQNTADDKES
jgi:hypothetical protein